MKTIEASGVKAIFVRTGFYEAPENLAAEELLLKDRTGEYLLIYENNPCVVVGKYQNIYEEVRLPYTEPNGVPVYRRESGGGAVYHGKGNINFSFIGPAGDEPQQRYDEATGWIVSALNSIGIPAYVRGACDIVLKDGKTGTEKKISGSAQCVKSGRSLVHGTLLYNADIEALRASLSPPSGTYTSRAIKSRKSPVSNIYPLFCRASTDEFITHLCEFIPHLEEYSFTSEEKYTISELVSSKYRDEGFIFGMSPKCVFNNRVEISGGVFTSHITVEKGIIMNADIFWSKEPAHSAAVVTALTGRPYRFESCVHALSEVFPDDSELCLLLAHEMI
ncbi:MAG: hypothetical protein VB118_08445 [Oscillospiraceae bacterium]|nr:hypothetical protein [Oscillospiraceae bacterium]